MYLRNTAIAVFASGLLALPAAASASPASPVPDPPSHQVTYWVQAAIDLLWQAYARAPIWEKRSIHNEIVLLINVGHAAL